MLLEDYMDRVSGRLLSETSTSEIAIDGRRPPYTTRSDITCLVYIHRTVLTGRQNNNNTVIINVYLFSHSQQYSMMQNKTKRISENTLETPQRPVYVGI
jgi:hypothetical protein